MVSGKENKGECYWNVFQHELESAMSEGLFSDEHVMLGVRMALQRTAAEMGSLNISTIPYGIYTSSSGVYSNLN